MVEIKSILLIVKRERKSFKSVYNKLDKPIEKACSTLFAVKLIVRGVLFCCTKTSDSIRRDRLGIFKAISQPCVDRTISRRKPVVSCIMVRKNWKEEK